MREKLTSNRRRISLSESELNAAKERISLL
jgi:hypothetical protein